MEPPPHPPSADTEGSEGPADAEAGLSAEVQQAAVSIARSMEVHEVHRFHELSDGTILYVVRGDEGFTAATVSGEAAQLEFLRRLALDRPRRGVPAPYAEEEVAELEGRLGVALPALLRCYLTEVSSAWRPRPFSVGQDRPIDIGPFGVLRVRTRTLLGEKRAADAAADGAGAEETSSLLELVPFTHGAGKGVVVAGRGHGLAVCIDENDESADGGSATVPLWSVMFDAFF